MYEFVSENGMAFHPRYWDRGVKNGSRNFNYYRWNAESRKNAAQHIGRDTRVQPHAEEPLELEPEMRFVMPPGGVIVFSGAQLHSTVPNTTNMVRWSIDFRTVNIDDVASKRGAPNTDSASTGTSLRDFLRVAHFAPIPEDIVAEYDDGTRGRGGRLQAGDGGCISSLNSIAKRLRVPKFAGYRRFSRSTVTRRE
jgi:hypothetical protein